MLVFVFVFVFVFVLVSVLALLSGVSLAEVSSGAFLAFVIPFVCSCLFRVFVVSIDARAPGGSSIISRGPAPLRRFILELSMKIRILVLAGLIIGAAAGAVSTQAPATVTPPKLSSFDPQANALIARMTLDEKVGQMTQPDQDFMADPTDIETYFLGSVLSGGDSDPKTNTVEDWADMYDRYQSHALRTRLKIPLLYGVDAVHGHNNVLGAVVFPHNIGLGATRNAKLVEEIGRITAKEVRTTGINWAFAPCVAVPRDERWGRTYEGFGEEPGMVAEL